MAISKEELAEAAKTWRGNVPAHAASMRVGIPKRTWEGIEQKRGFPYPKLLLLAMKAVSAEDQS